ncbi:MAG TPA: hypothetical protein VHS28_02405, partial [Chloroflexota bacterium]|nr:hypothetical protein [Chloroflexota bacterium]
GPHFLYLAAAFLHGQLSLSVVPGEPTDLLLYQGRYFVYYPPLPALLLMPFVALFGPGMSDAAVTVALGALNVSLVSLLLSSLDRSGLVSLAADKRAWLTAFFALGTTHTTVAPHAHAASMALLTGFAAMCAAYVVALRLSGSSGALVSGSLVAAAFLCRNTLILPGLWVAWHLLRGESYRGKGALVRTALCGVAPMMGAVGIMGVYDYLRFGSPWDLGLVYSVWNSLLEPDVKQFGPFSLRYISGNLYYTFANIPYLSLLREGSGVNFWMGGSLFLMSPLFLWAGQGVRNLGRREGVAIASSWLLGMLPILTWVSTGWVQFGPRLTLDTTVPLMVATAAGVSRLSTQTTARLSMIAMVMYLPGSLLLGAIYG